MTGELVKRAARRSPLWPLLAAARRAVDRRLGIVYDPRRYWEEHADEYTAHRLGRSDAAERAETAALMADITSLDPRTVLEVGCAYGRLLRRLSDTGTMTALVGVDLSERMLELARTHLESRLVALVRADASRLPFPDRSFDVAYSYGLLMHVPPASIGAVVAELCRVAGRGVAFLETGFPRGHKRGRLESYAFDRAVFAHDYAGLFEAHGWRLSRERVIGPRVGLLFER